MAQNNPYDRDRVAPRELSQPHTTRNRARALVKLATVRETLTQALELVPKANRAAIESSLKEGMRLLMDEIRTAEGL